MLQGSRCSRAAGSSAPTATELYHAAKRSWPSGLAEGFSTSTTFLRTCWVAGSSEASSWYATCRPASKPAGSSPWTEYWNRAMTGSLAAISAARAGEVLRGSVSSATSVRSEEHTSELQSRPHLVCRLLLEKKKIS